MVGSRQRNAKSGLVEFDSTKGRTRSKDHGVSEPRFAFQVASKAPRLFDCPPGSLAALAMPLSLGG
jgi:hypothetical protein